MRCLAAAFLTTALAVTASCDSSDAQSPTMPSGTVQAPVRGGTFRMVLEAPVALDPATVDSVYDALPVHQIFDGIVALDPGLNVVPALADTWTISRDSRLYTFHLRTGVRFHDGSPLTSDDVVFSIKRLLDPKLGKKKSIGASYLQVVDGAPAYASGKAPELVGLQALDPQTLQISLSHPYLSFLEVLAMDDLRIVPRGVVTRMGEAAFRRSPVGTGPFKFGSWTKMSLTLVANTDYWGGAPYLDGVVINFPDVKLRDNGNAKFLAGETEIVEPSSDNVASLLQDPTVEMHRYQDLSLSFMGLNTGARGLQDERVRRAIAMAVDRKALADLAPSNRREAQGILPPGLPGYSATPKAMAFDPEGARKLLAEAGYPGGRGLPPIEFYTAQAAATANTKTNELLKSNLADVGVKLVIHETTWSELITHIEDNAAPSFQLGWVADLPDPDAFLRTLFEPGGSANYFSFLDRPTAAALERGASEINPMERTKIYRELERSILEKAPLVPLFHSVGMIASRKTVHGFKPGPLGVGSLDLEHVWLTPAGSKG
ncbi:MAG TPA: ABC transporter substrate-binding protein [Candidatus Polarisedimenticolaceae bacterium]|nr:ABC transporter substrate-binding protein [Candidatus Polarisedimenticolaceae bacterium]